MKILKSLLALFWKFPFTNYAKILKLFYGALRNGNLWHADEIFLKNFHLKPWKILILFAHMCVVGQISKKCVWQRIFPIPMLSTTMLRCVLFFFTSIVMEERRRKTAKHFYVFLPVCVCFLHALLLLAFHSISTDDDSHRTIVRRDGNEEGGKRILHKILKLQAFVTFFLREFNIHKTHDKHT